MKYTKVAAGFVSILVLAAMLIRWIGPICAVSLGFFAIAISIVFVAVFSKAYRNWPG